MIALLAITSRLARRAATRSRRHLLTLAAASLVIAINWGTYIYGVTNGHVLEVSLGYFITPVVTVLMGVVVLGERLRPAQWGALCVAGLAIGVLAVQSDRPPWIAVVLALSFGTYGLLQRTVSVGAVEGPAIETAVLVPVATAYLLLLGAGGSGTLTTQGPAHAVLLLGAGFVTAVPLLLFGAAASRVPLTTLGLLQYVAPSVQFLPGVALFREPLPALRLLGLLLVWLALAVFVADLVRHRARASRGAAT